MGFPSLQTCRWQSPGTAIVPGTVEAGVMPGIWLRLPELRVVGGRQGRGGTTWLGPRRGGRGGRLGPGASEPRPPSHWQPAGRARSRARHVELASGTAAKNFYFAPQQRISLAESDEGDQHKGPAPWWLLAHGPRREAPIRRIIPSREPLG
jgi:hypothetical protein